jgi:hypothetical protein
MCGDPDSGFSDQGLRYPGHVEQRLYADWNPYVSNTFLGVSQHILHSVGAAKPIRARADLLHSAKIAALPSVRLLCICDDSNASMVAGEACSTEVVGITVFVRYRWAFRPNACTSVCSIL